MDEEAVVEEEGGAAAVAEDVDSNRIRLSYCLSEFHRSWSLPVVYWQGFVALEGFCYFKLANIEK